MTLGVRDDTRDSSTDSTVLLGLLNINQSSYRTPVFRTIYNPCRTRHGYGTIVPELTSPHVSLQYVWVTISSDKHNYIKMSSSYTEYCDVLLSREMLPPCQFIIILCACNVEREK